jgi:hypothetical protein
MALYRVQEKVSGLEASYRGAACFAPEAPHAVSLLRQGSMSHL